MIHFHGGPITPLEVAAKVWNGRHGMVSFAYPDQDQLAFEVCQSVALDNGAFTSWKQGKKTSDWNLYYAWVKEWRSHPAFDFALIPDVIEGDESANDHEVDRWPFGATSGVPVWHLHESMGRLERLIDNFPRVALGSSGDYSEPGTQRWWSRISEAMEVCCDQAGKPRTKLHGLRMLDPTIFSYIPFSSADSTNIAVNIGIDSRWRGSYTPLTKTMRALVLADRIEAHASAARWAGPSGIQKNLELVG